MRGGSAAQDLLNPTVPLPSWRAGDFSALAPATVIRDPSASNAPFAGNRIPTARLNPVSLKIQERFYPLPNFGGTSVLRTQNYREVKTRGFDKNDYWTTRIDHRFSQKATSTAGTPGSAARTPVLTATCRRSASAGTRATPGAPRFRSPTAFVPRC